MELGDIESAILKHPGISNTAVTAIEINGEKSLCAYFTALKEIDVAILRDMLKIVLPDYMVPQFYVQLEKMPITGNGKLDRKALPLPTPERVVTEYTAPSTELEAKIQKCVCEVLKADKISCTADLFEHGLSSLGVITVITDLSSEGYEFKVKDFYENKTIAGIAKMQSIIIHILCRVEKCILDGADVFDSDFINLQFAVFKLPL